MKKVINHPLQVVDEMVEGFMAAHGAEYEKLEGVNAIVVKQRKGKVGIVIGGGSGHEPLFLGFVGEGMADGVAIGNVFAAPTPNTVYQAARAVDCGQGVLFLIVNYAGDVLNFEMAAELAEIDGLVTETVAITDDVASAPVDRIGDRRGIAGAFFIYKIAGAAADLGLPLDEVARVARKANDYTRTISVALTPASIPGSDGPTFTLEDDEIEFGMGIHGEPGVIRTRMMSADDLVDNMLSYVLRDLPFAPGDEVCVLVNGLGASTLMELLIVNRRITHLLREREISILDTEIDSYCTTQEMGGVSITLIKMDEELKTFYDHPAHTPYYSKRGRKESQL